MASSSSSSLEGRAAAMSAAEEEVDKILKEAVDEFEAEEGLAQKSKSGRVDRRLAEEMKGDALGVMEKLVDNLRNPAFASTLASTLQALSGTSAGARTTSEAVRDDEVDLDRAMATTMESFATHAADMEGMDSAQFASSGETMMTNMIAEFEKLGRKEDFDQAVENMMRQLLARDLMYEPMKLVCEEYPVWLAEHREGLTSAEYVQYGTQYQYFQRIVAVYEHEPENFPRLVELLQDLQEYGQPPAEIIKQLAPGLEFSKDGLPIMNMGDNVFPDAAAAANPRSFFSFGGNGGVPMPDESAVGCGVS
ncbi:hypothetical protein CTAYLR_001163 [Chrysophaeum taylorii]|uniref:Peroxin-19 n=1 Tax=Chrysophaeum taylorii TaxID=2483200 RepID=A0AAD7XQN8_9STRA|nr:hypothetical protein CTAYLR_001163 [Chrysophaeum taylorii]